MRLSLSKHTCVFVCVIKQRYEPHGDKTNNMIFQQVRHKLACTVTEDGQKLEILYLERMRIAKTKTLTCVFVFAYICILLFSHDACSNEENALNTKSC